MKTKRIVILGHAVGDERGKKSGGQLGSQSGEELRLQEWYNRSLGWTSVLRAKNKSLRAKIALYMLRLVLNTCIGYDQVKRTTLFLLANNTGWNINKINKSCATDCSALVSVVLNFCGVKISKDIYTGNMVSTIMATGLFKELTDKKYLTSSDYLEEGDILVGPGHTAAVVEVKEIPKLERTLMNISPALKGDDVKALQTVLKEHGFYNGSINGTFSSRTEKALIRYQSTHGLTADGICGKKSAESLGFFWN